MNGNFDAPPTDLLLRELPAARARLSNFVHFQAIKTQSQVDLSWRPSTLAPDTYEAAEAEFRSCQASGLPYRVSSLHCDHIIFVRAHINMAMRFYHDMTHLRLEADFTYDGERQVAQAHLTDLEARGYDSDSLSWQLLYADTIGQLELVTATGAFPTHQLRFALRVVRFGLDNAIEAELLDRHVAA